MNRLPCPFCPCCARYGCELDGDPTDCDRLNADDQTPCPCPAFDYREEDPCTPAPPATASA